MTYDQAIFIPSVGAQKIRYRLGDNTDIFEGEIFGEDTAPAGCSELYLTHISLLVKDSLIVRLKANSYRDVGN